jgi:hypothetical protein
LLLHEPARERQPAAVARATDRGAVLRHVLPDEDAIVTDTAGEAEVVVL